MTIWNADPPPAEYVDQLRKRLGVRDPNSDPLLVEALTVATAWVGDRVYPVDQDPATRHPEVVEAIMILASRLFARRNSPEGVTSWPDLGIVRIVAHDPDITSLLERHMDFTNVGIA